MLGMTKKSEDKGKGGKCEGLQDIPSTMTKNRAYIYI